jgi:hypothetical protein
MRKIGILLLAFIFISQAGNSEAAIPALRLNLFMNLH